MRVNVEVLTGTYIDTDVSENSTVKDLKEKIATERNLPLNRLILLVGDNERRRVVSDYEDETLLVDLGVRDGSHMYLFFKHLDLICEEERGGGGGGGRREEYGSMENMFLEVERNWECEVKANEKGGREEGRDEMEVENGRETKEDDAGKNDAMDVDKVQEEGKEDDETEKEEEAKDEDGVRGKEKEKEKAEDEEVRGVEGEEDEAKKEEKAKGEGEGEAKEAENVGKEETETKEEVNKNTERGEDEEEKGNGDDEEGEENAEQKTKP